MIVVGVDGSELSKQALRWAVEEARRRDTVVRAIFAWEKPAPLGWDYVPPEVLAASNFEKGAWKILDTSVDEVLGEDTSVVVERVVTVGLPAQVLIDASRDAQLLVLGSRGHGGFSGLLVGSVSQECVHHASCPVVVVKPVPVAPTAAEPERELAGAGR
jgi:nucleotide-binding universal stress UspA family protein